MSIPFEQYAAERVPKLRAKAAALIAEADALERALRSYEEEREPLVEATKPASVRLIVRTPGPGIQEGSQTFHVIGTAESVKEKGVTLQEIYKRLADAGITNEASIRSVVWNQKKMGRLVLRGDRYYAPAYAPAENDEQPNG